MEKPREKRNAPLMIHLDSAKSCTYEVPQSQIASEKSGFGAESRGFGGSGTSNSHIDIIFSEAKRSMVDSNKIRAYNLATSRVNKHNFS